MVRVLAIDPGAVHCGVALFENGKCLWAREVGPWEIACEIAGLHADRDHDLVVVIESFRLSPTGAKALVGDAMGTVEVIGVVRYVCRRCGIELVEQQPNIKRATESIMRSRGITLTSRGNGAHAKDAELHGWCYLMRGGGDAVET